MTYTPTREDKAASILVDVFDNYGSPLRDQIATLHLALGHEHFSDISYAQHLASFTFDMGALADNLAKELGKVSDVLGQRRDETDWGAVRQRIKVAVKALEIDTRDAQELLDKSDEDLNASGPLVAFAKRHGLSLDWLVAGDVTPLLRSAASKRH